MYKQWFEVICYTCSKILWVNHHSLVVIFDRLVMELLVVGTPLWLFTSCCIYQIMSHCTSQYSAFIGLQPAFNRNRYIEGEEKLLRYSYLIVLVELARTSDVLNFKLVKNLSIEEIKQYREEKKVIIILMETGMCNVFIRNLERCFVLQFLPEVFFSLCLRVSLLFWVQNIVSTSVNILFDLSFH